MDLDTLQKLNSQYEIKDIHDLSFQTYGRVIEASCEDAINYVDINAVSPELGTSYQPSVSDLEQMSSIKSLALNVYGGLNLIVGIVVGYNQIHRGMEYHQGSETVIAVTDCVLVLGHVWDMQDDTYQNENSAYFYVPKVTIGECFSTTLHYTPISLSDEGFKNICFLLKGTGDAFSTK